MRFIAQVVKQQRVDSQPSYIIEGKICSSAIFTDGPRLQRHFSEIKEGRKEGERKYFLLLLKVETACDPAQSRAREQKPQVRQEPRKYIAFLIKQRAHTCYSFFSF